MFRMFSSLTTIGIKRLSLAWEYKYVLFTQFVEKIILITVFPSATDIILNSNRKLGNQ